MDIPLFTLMLVSKWEKTLADMFPHKIESLPRRVEAVVVALGTVQKSIYGGVWVSTYLWPFTVMNVTDVGMEIS